MSASDLRNHLKLLEIEREEVDACGLADYEQYRRDLEEEIDVMRAAYVFFAVIEIAQFRADLACLDPVRY
jgi:hypothetical protein